MANLFTQYLKQAYVPQVITNVTRNTFWLSQPHFEIVPASQCPAGASIYGIMDTSFSSNAAIYTQGNPMVDPGSIASATYRFDKDFFQNSSKLY